MLHNNVFFSFSVLFCFDDSWLISMIRFEENYFNNLTFLSIFPYVYVRLNEIISDVREDILHLWICKK